MKVRDAYNYDASPWDALREPARQVVAAYQQAARFLDTVQESVYIEHGLVHTARILHNLAHEMPKRFDVFADMLHERHLMAEYPATPELTERVEDMDKAFEIVIAALDDIQAALEAFRSVTDNGTLRPMALKAEELMTQNSRDYTNVLNMWAMWDESESKTSFDNWALRMGGD